MRCIFVLDLFKICFGRLPQKHVLKSRFFAVTFKTNRKNQQVQGIVDSILFHNVSSDHTALIFQFLGKSCSSSHQVISCRRHYLGRDSFRFISRRKDHGGVLLHNYHSGYRVERAGEGEGLLGNTCESA